MNLLKWWWDLSSFAAAEQGVDQQRLIPQAPVLSVTDEEPSLLSTTFLLPVTVGLSTVVVSVLLGFRNRAATDGSALRAQEHKAVSVSGKRKSTSGKSLTSCWSGKQDIDRHIRTELNETTIPVLHSSSTPNRRQEHPSTIDNTQPPPSPEQGVVTLKKSKKRSTKSKRPAPMTASKTLNEEFTKDGFLNDAESSDDHDPWVTVTTKRPSRSQQFKKPDKITGEDNNKVLDRQLIQERPVEGLSLSISTSLQSSCTTMSPATVSPAYALRSSEISSSIGSGDQNSPTQTISRPMYAVLTPPNVTASRMCTASSPLLPKKPAHQTGDAGGHCQLSTPAEETYQEPNIRESVALSSNTSDFIRQHMSAQLQAKELECQLLRDEVIHLRGEVKSALLQTAHSTPASANTRLDAETMTDVNGDAAVTARLDTNRCSPISTSSQLSSPPPACASSEPVDLVDTSTVLLIPLQAEIKRLAKEVTLSHQRNENLEFRLAVAKKQLAERSVNTVPAATFKAAEEELSSQAERALTAERQLTDVQFNFDRQAGIVKEWEKSCADLMEKMQLRDSENTALLASNKQLQQAHSCLTEEMDGLRHKYDCLLVKHTELEESRNDLMITLQRQETSHATLSSNYDQVERAKESMRQEFEGLLAKYKTVEGELKCAEELMSELRQGCMSACDRHRQSVDEHQRHTVDLNHQLEEYKAHQDRLTRETEELRGLLMIKQQEVEELTRKVQSTEKERYATLVDNTAFLRSDDFVSPGEKVCEGRAVPVSTPLVDVVVSQLTVSQLTAAEIDPDDEDAQQRHRYKQALDCTENMLSRIQASVNEEEQRWKKALDASETERHLLASKVNQLESSLATVMGERDSLAKSLQWPQEQTVDTDGLSVHSNDTAKFSSISLPRLVMDASSGAEFSHSTSPHELLAHIGRLSHLVRIGRNALKQEQDKSAHLEAELKSSCLQGKTKNDAEDQAVRHEDGLSTTPEAVTDTTGHLSNNETTDVYFEHVGEQTVDMETKASGGDNNDDDEGSPVVGSLRSTFAATSDTLHPKPII